MGIISLSVSEKLLKEIDRLIESEGYSSRSEIFRAGIRELFENKKENLEGPTKCLLVVANKRCNEDRLIKVKHEYEDLIETRMHTHLNDERCTEIFVLSGQGGRIKELMIKLRKGGAEKIMLIPS